MTVGTDGAVLDASALLAYILDEDGSEVVEAALFDRPVINVVNYAEVLSRLTESGEDSAEIHRQLEDQGLIGELLHLLPLVADDCVAIARLRNLTRAQGLSLGDRACLATALRLGRTVITADRSWAAVDVGVAVHLIRS